MPVSTLATPPLTRTAAQLIKVVTTIAVGMLADIAILSADVFTVPPDQMEGIRSVMTLFGGRIVHDNGSIH